MHIVVSKLYVRKLKNSKFEYKFKKTKCRKTIDSKFKLYEQNLNSWIQIYSLILTGTEKEGSTSPPNNLLGKFWYFLFQKWWGKAKYSPKIRKDKKCKFSGSKSKIRCLGGGSEAAIKLQLRATWKKKWDFFIERA